jgi:triosephosphate isomerase
MSRRPIVAGNWKMNLTAPEGAVLATDLVATLGGSAEDCDVVICPPFTSLAAVQAIIESSPIELGAQNMHAAESGAFTGEISPGMILTSGCTYAILGHSERRQLFGEVDKGVNAKLVRALAAGLNPIVCIGETLGERDAGDTETIVLGQVRAALQGVEPAEAARVVLAYEPVWAIGTGKTATAEQAAEVHGLIRDFLGKTIGVNVARNVRIQYGGSVKPENAAELFSCPDIDGGLIGGASLNAIDFANIVKAA